MTWKELHKLISELAKLERLDIRSSAKILGCEFTRVRNNRYLASNLVNPLACADLRIQDNQGILILNFANTAHTSSYLQEMRQLSPPVDVQIVSPPIYNPDDPDTRPQWDSKYSTCLEFQSRKVWFGIEKHGSEEKLVSISIHYEDEPHG